MHILDRYIVTNVVRAVLLVALLVVGLFVLVLLIDELDDVGTGAYTWPDALRYVLFQAPAIALEFASFIALIGTIIALGMLAGHNELVAMLSLSMAPSRVIKPVILAVLVLMVAMLANAQFLLPKTLQTAHIDKQLATEQMGDVRSDEGYWAQSNATFLHVGEVRHGRVPANIEIYEYDDDFQLVQFIQAQSASIEEDNRWLLNDVRLKVFRQSEPHYESHTHIVWNSFLTSAQLGIILTPAEALSLTDLYHYIGGLEERGEPAHRFELILWQRLLVPVATALMVLLGAQFVFGSTRSVSMGKRITIAVLVGLFFYFLTRITGNLGSVLKIEPLWVASIPVLLMAATLFLQKRFSAGQTD